MDNFIAKVTKAAEQLVENVTDSCAEKIIKGEIEGIPLNGSDESKREIADLLRKEISKKKASPKAKSSDKESPKWIPPEDFLALVKDVKTKVQNALDIASKEGELTEEEEKDIIRKNTTIYCPWYCKKGSEEKVKKTCAAIIDDGGFLEQDYSVRCKSCKRNSSEKSTKFLVSFYDSIDKGAEVTGSPVGGVNSPNNVQELAGLKKDDVTTPTKFLDGDNEGVPSPDTVKGKKKTPKSSLSLSPLKNSAENEEYSDFYNKKPINDSNSVFLFRKNNETNKFSIGGKWPEDTEKYDTSNYLEKILETDESDEATLDFLEKKLSINYTYLGTVMLAGGKSDEEDDDEADNIADLLLGLEDNDD
jgi:hypothetical protein